MWLSAGNKFCLLNNDRTKNIEHRRIEKQINSNTYIDNGNVSEEESSDGNVSDGDYSSNEDDDYVSPN
jgi:hypothetical protein